MTLQRNSRSTRANEQPHQESILFVPRPCCVTYERARCAVCRRRVWSDSMTCVRCVWMRACVCVDACVVRSSLVKSELTTVLIPYHTWHARVCGCVCTRVHARAAACRHACTHMQMFACVVLCACVECYAETSQSDACVHTAAAFCILFNPVAHTHDPSLFPMDCHKRTWSSSWA